MIIIISWNAEDLFLFTFENCFEALIVILEIVICLLSIIRPFTKKHIRRNHIIDVCTFVHKTKSFLEPNAIIKFFWWHVENSISDVHFIWCMIDDSSICFIYVVGVHDVSAMIFLVWTMKLLFYDTNIVDWSVISSLH